MAWGVLTTGEAVDSVTDVFQCERIVYARDTLALDGQIRLIIPRVENFNVD